jgi:WD40 repeat protein
MPFRGEEKLMRIQSLISVLVILCLCATVLCAFVQPVRSEETDDPVIPPDEYEPIRDEEPPVVEEPLEEPPVEEETTLPVSDDVESGDIPFIGTMNATLLWNVGVARLVLSSAITEDGSHIVVGTHRSGIAYLLDRNGNILWSKLEQVPVYGISISPEGSHIAVASDKLELLYPSGDAEWTLNTGYFVYGVDLSADAEYIVMGSDDDKVYLKDREGTTLWEYQTENSVYGVSISRDGSVVAAGSDDSRVYLLTQDGELLWSYKTGNPVRCVEVSGDGSYVVAGSYDRIVYFFDRTGLLLWKYPMGERINSVAISPDGFYVAACGGARTRIFDRSGRTLWEFDSKDTGKYVGSTSQGNLVGPEITTIALSHGASHMIIGTGSGDQRIYMYGFSAPVSTRMNDSSLSPPELQKYLHNSLEPGMEVSTAAYIVSIRSVRPLEGNVTVAIAVPAAWADSMANTTVAICMWNSSPGPVQLDTRFVGLDLQGNPIYEASAPTMNATFGAILVPRVPVAGPVIAGPFIPEWIVPVGITIVAVLCTAGFLWARRSRSRRPALTEEEELRSVQESLKSLISK